MNTLSDNALMLRVKSGELSALGLLYERYKKRLFGFFYQLNRDPSLSEDLVQNVFVRILKYKGSYTDEKKFISWIFQIARNVNNDHFAKNKKNIELGSFPKQEIFDLSMDFALEENKKLLQEAINKLSPEKQELIVLSKIKEIKYRDVADILGSTEGAVRTKVHRVLQELREIFNELEKR